MEVKPGDKICIPVPLYHCFGMILGNMAAISKGCTMVYPSDSFDPKITIDVTSKE